MIQNVPEKWNKISVSRNGLRMIFIMLQQNIEPIRARTNKMGHDKKQKSNKHSKLLNKYDYVLDKRRLYI